MKRLAMCDGDSGVATAKFRVGEREYTSGWRKHYFRRRVGLEYVEIVLPMGTDADLGGGSCCADWSLLLEVLQLIKETIPTNSDRPPAEVLEVVRKDLLALPLTLEFLEL